MEKKNKQKATHFNPDLLHILRDSPEQPSVDNLLTVYLFAKKMAEYMIISPHLDKYIQAYQIPEDLNCSMLPKDMPNPIDQKRYLFVLDIMVTILSLYYCNLSANEFLNNYVVNKFSELELISELKDTIPQEILYKIDLLNMEDDVSGFENIDMVDEMDELKAFSPVSSEDDKIDQNENIQKENPYIEQMNLYHKQLENFFQNISAEKQLNENKTEEMKEIQKAAEKSLFMAISLINSLHPDEHLLLEKEKYHFPQNSNEDQLN